MAYKSARSKATDIPQRVKQNVWERDQRRCIICGSHQAMPNAHVIPRSKGGLGVEENIVTLCIQCHHDYDQTKKHDELDGMIKDYLRKMYQDWDDLPKIFKKWSDI